MLEDVTDGPRQAAFRVVQRSYDVAIQSQLQDESVARQQDVVPVQRDHLETQQCDAVGSNVFGLSLAAVGYFK